MRKLAIMFMLSALMLSVSGCAKDVDVTEGNIVEPEPVANPFDPYEAPEPGEFWYNNGYSATIESTPTMRIEKDGDYVAYITTNGDACILVYFGDNAYLSVEDTIYKCNFFEIAEVVASIDPLKDVLGNLNNAVLSAEDSFNWYYSITDDAGSSTELTVSKETKKLSEVKSGSITATIVSLENRSYEEEDFTSAIALPEGEDGITIIKDAFSLNAVNKEETEE